MSDKPKILLVCDSRKDAEAILGQAVESHELVVVQNPIRALAHLTHEQFAGVYVAAEHLQEAFEIGKLFQNEQILEGMPDGVVLLASDNTILWANSRVREWSGARTVGGRQLLQRPGQPGDPRPRFLSLPHGVGHRPGHQLHVAFQRRPLFPGPRRAGRRAARGVAPDPAAAPDRHRPRRHPGNPAAAEAGRHSSGRHGVGRSQPGRVVPDECRAANRPAQGEHSPLHQGPAELRGGRGPAAGSEDRPAGAAAGGGDGAGGGQPRALCPAAEERRHRLRGGHRQELPLRRYHRRPAVPRRGQGREKLADGAAGACTTR